MKGFVKVREADAHVRQWSRSFGGEYVPIEDHRGTRHGRRPALGTLTIIALL